MLFLLACRAPEPCVGLDLNEDDVCDRDAADWSAGAPAAGHNPYQLAPDDLDAATEAGWRHALSYPVDVTQVLLPYRPMEHFFEPANEDAAPMRAALAAATGYDSLETMYDGVGLLPYDDGDEAWAQPMPDLVDTTRMGVTVLDTPQGEGLTFSCAACHTGRFLGRSIRGLTNRRPRSNAFFVLGQDVLPQIPEDVFQNVTGADADELEMLADTAAAFRRVGLRTPLHLGLDTSLAQVALSLARRGDGPKAPTDPARELNPLANGMETEPADSKPMPWWTLKHKNRWLSDGSIVQGNPVFTNFLWNEIGRGVDLDALDLWLTDNAQVVDELTVAVFNSQAPHWSEFPLPAIDAASAGRGLDLFDAHCASCHGAPTLDGTRGSLAYEVHPPVDVGTDRGRVDGIQHFGPRLNELDISKAMDTVVEVQDGYIPPPLDGIFTRYPYLHNGSIPNLCELLTAPADRIEVFVQGPSEGLEDYDASCVGYPTEPPEHWDTTDAYVTNLAAGTSNAGHVPPELTADERDDLIEFLKVL